MQHISNGNAVGIALAILIPVALYFIYSAYQTRQRMRLRKAVIDKFSSAEDFAAFVQSSAGQSFISSLSNSPDPVRAVISSIQKGVILLLLGGGLWCVGITLEAAAEVASVGILLLCVGVGILVAAGVSYYLLKTWGLMGKHAVDTTKDRWPSDQASQPERNDWRAP